MTGEFDISRVIGLIMENPKLIEQIAALAKGTSSPKDEAVAPQITEESVPEVREPVAEDKESVQSSVPIRDRSYGMKNRSQLLGALKPYVSRERAQAIDSMLSIVEILDVMKGG
ncbi:MAG: hypothetical protein J6Q85_06415 [Clostridia bacterium]|nr:hypothetical protein [Clostridia bacterium]